MSKIVNSTLGKFALPSKKIKVVQTTDRKDSFLSIVWTTLIFFDGRANFPRVELTIFDEKFLLRTLRHWLLYISFLLEHTILLKNKLFQRKEYARISKNFKLGKLVNWALLYSADDTQHKGIQHKDTQHNGTQHNDTQL